MLSMTTPTVSVVIPVHNGAWCVKRAIDSVLAQSFRDFEIIAVDDGSTDATPAILAEYGDALRIIRKPNGGLSSARNAGIDAARGKYVAFLDADDRWLPGKLAQQIVVMERDPQLVFCSTNVRVEGPQGESLGEWRCGRCSGNTLEDIFAANAHVAGSGSSVVARRSAFAQLGGFDEALPSLEDIDMWMRLSTVGNYACIDEPLGVIVKRPDSMSRHLDVMRDAAITVMKKNRSLLAPDRRGAFWRSAYAAMLSDYAKWAYREGRTGQAMRDLGVALLTSPLRRGRLALGLLAGVARGQRL